MTNRIYFAENVSVSRMKRLNVYVKKMSKFGAYIEAEETKLGKFSVAIYCELVHTDKYGNSALMRKTRKILHSTDDVYN